MKISDFDFNLPKELIAQTPAKPRDHARLLIYNRANKTIIDDFFYNLDKYLPKDSSITLNDSKVEKCRLVFGKIEVFVLETMDDFTVRALVRPGKKFTAGSKLAIKLKNRELNIQTLSVDNDGIRLLKLSHPINSPLLNKYSLTPFPPYIDQNEKLSSQYQTVYATPTGSKAAPTAGLHFTKKQLASLAKDHQIITLTLHVGLGTFLPVKTDDISRHKMHSEDFVLSAQAANKLNQAKHITAVGTTTARVLESLDRPFKPSAGPTDIFITPGYQFKAVDSLITNFHLPKSTLLMLLAAFVGSVDETQHIYKHAIKKGYRFYSFGDAMLIL